MRISFCLFPLLVPFWLPCFVSLPASIHAPSSYHVHLLFVPLDSCFFDRLARNTEVYCNFYLLCCTQICLLKYICMYEGKKSYQLKRQHFWNSISINVIRYNPKLLIQYLRFGVEKNIDTNNLVALLFYLFGINVDINIHQASHTYEISLRFKCSSNVAFVNTSRTMFVTRKVTSL